MGLKFYVSCKPITFVDSLETITDKDKEKLQNMMAYGRDMPQKNDKKTAVVESEPEADIDRFEEGLTGEIVL